MKVKIATGLDAADLHRLVSVPTHRAFVAVVSRCLNSRVFSSYVPNSLAVRGFQFWCEWLFKISCASAPSCSAFPHTIRKQRIPWAVVAHLQVSLQFV